MQFSHLSIANWRQFDEIEVEFHPRITILTGSNGAGKATLLNMLSRSIGWAVALLSVPSSHREALKRELASYSLPLQFEEPPTGHIILANGHKIELGLQEGGELSQSFGSFQEANGVYITSHRHLFSYSKVENIPTDISAASELLEAYTERLRSVYQKPRIQELIKVEQTPSFRLKQSLISLAMFGEGNSIISPNDDALSTFHGFENVLRYVLPEEIGFERFYIRMPDLFMISRSGMFPLEALSGGAGAIIDLAWQVFLASRVYSDYAVIIDEPENHLHPSLQKRILSSFISAFPNAQFVCATHSPLIINSVEDSSVYAIVQTTPGRFTSRLLDFFNKASSSQDTLYEVLGVDGSAPVWANRRVEEIFERYQDAPDNIEALESMRNELREAGLADRITEVLSRFIERSRDQAN